MEDNARAFDHLLAELREGAGSLAEQGERFERLMQKWLQTAPLYAETYDEVWLWRDFPNNGGRHDFGIDLVARKRDTGEYTAIQCKFYGDEHSVSKQDMDTFLSASGKEFETEEGPKRFVERIVISSTDKWSSTADDVIRGQDPPVTRIRLRNLRESGVDWASLSLHALDEMHRQEHKTLRPHQKEALNDVVKGFQDADRGKLIMACGTGKTYTSLRIAETVTGGKGDILFLVPSIALLNQSLLEWAAQCEESFAAFAICSDPKAGRRNVKKYDLPPDYVSDAVIPATTDASRLVEAYEAAVRKQVPFRLFFATYQSIDVISRFQAETDVVFDLIICDEAHRTTGVTLSGQDESAFVRIHNDKFVAGKKRLYMTATPRVYGKEAARKAEENNAILCSMDDTEMYGKVFHELRFGKAVEAGLLSDYRVLILAVDEDYAASLGISSADDTMRPGENGEKMDPELTLDDKVKIVGCINGLSKYGMLDEDKEDFSADPAPMKRAVAFTSSIKNSVIFAQRCAEVQEEIHADSPTRELVNIAVKHVDGTQDVLIRQGKLDWLKDDIPDGECRILSNARCLSEGIDVPALDAIMFLNPRDSMIDIIQAVGRVMRKAEGKKYGYILLPIGIKADVPPEVALDNNKKYAVIWKVLQALRAHDDRMDSTINKIELNRSRSKQIQVVGMGGETKQKPGEEETGAGAGTETDNGQENKQKAERENAKRMEEEAADLGSGEGQNGPEKESHEGAKDQQKSEQLRLQDVIRSWTEGIMARIVRKCGTRIYWETWAKDIAKIAERVAEHIRKTLNGEKAGKDFSGFLEFLQTSLNSAVTQDDAVKMLAQHIITKPVFDALFDGYSFADHNPVSIVMDSTLAEFQEILQDEGLVRMGKFYESVRRRASGIDNAAGKQKIVTELYNNFFRDAFPLDADKLGIVYTPVEVVDFIVRSVAYVLKESFDKELADEGVHILDPFAGTGTFIVRLLESGLIPTDRLRYKYDNDLHANEIMLLPYYIGAVNIEETYHDIMHLEDYEPFPGIVLTDTFALSESDKNANGETAAEGDYFTAGLKEAFERPNTERAEKQLKTDITVIIGNPPYSVGQKSGNDNNEKVRYEHLDKRLADTYVKDSVTTSKRIVYDAYVRAFRWASDRLGKRGVVGFVTNGSFIDAPALDGFRKHLLKDFRSVYVFNLRGDARTKGETRRKENGNVFGGGSRAPIAITILVKDTAAVPEGFIRYYDIGDYLSRDEKLEIIRDKRSIENIDFQKITPNDAGDWISQRSLDYGNLFPLAAGKGNAREKASIFGNDALNGVTSNRDPWVYNFSAKSAFEHANAMLDVYNAERERVHQSYDTSLRERLITEAEKSGYLKREVCKDSQKISWSESLYTNLVANMKLPPAETVRISMYRPFCKKNLVYDKGLVHRMSRWGEAFVPGKSNREIAVSMKPKTGFSVLMTDVIPDLHLLEQINGLPMNLYESAPSQISMLIENSEKTTYIKHSTITDDALRRFRGRYGENVTDEDIFYYVYAVLQAPEYLSRYSDNLSKERPRIPFLEGFQEYVRIGRALGDLHVNYETSVDAETIPGLVIDKTGEDYRVEKMRFGKSDGKTARDTILFNSSITLRDIPPEVYGYTLCDRSAVEWIMECYRIKTDKKSGITDDPNTYSDDPKYIFNLLLSVMHVSLETQKLISELPKYKEI